MKSLITRWNLLPLYPSPCGFSASCLKFSAVFGTVPPNKPITIRPAGTPPIVISKKTFINKTKKYQIYQQREFEKKNL